MGRNLGQTKLRKRRRCADPMRAYDSLPPRLRRWLASAALPWRPQSVQRAYERALSRTGDPRVALQELDRLQDRQLARDGAWRPGA